MSISELSRIYPTPPSVETVMEVDKYDEIKEDRMEHIPMAVSTAATQWNASNVCHLLMYKNRHSFNLSDIFNRMMIVCH